MHTYPSALVALKWQFFSSWDRARKHVVAIVAFVAAVVLFSVRFSCVWTWWFRTNICRMLSCCFSPPRPPFRLPQDNSYSSFPIPSTEPDEAQHAPHVQVTLSILLKGNEVGCSWCHLLDCINFTDNFCDNSGTT